MTNQTGIRPAHVMIQGMPQTNIVVLLIADALRNYIQERMTETHFEDLDADAIAGELTLRRKAYTLLAVMDREPQVEGDFALPDNFYDYECDIKINGVTLPDQYHAVLIDVINEELINKQAHQGLYIIEEEQDKIKESEAEMNALMAVLMRMGVPVGANYMDKLLAE